MQLRIVYSSFTHTQTYDSGNALIGTSDINDQQFPSYAEVGPLYTPTSIIATVSETDAELSAILTVLGDPWTSVVNPYPVVPGTYPGLIGTGLMPDGNQFIELNLTELIDRTFDEWQWYVDNDPMSPDLPAGFSAAWMARRADVHTFKSNPVNHVVRIKTGKHNLYSGDENAQLVPTVEWGLSRIALDREVWIYDMGTGALLATDANMTLSTATTQAVFLRATSTSTSSLVWRCGSEVLDQLQGLRRGRVMPVHSHIEGGGSISLRAIQVRHFVIIGAGTAEIHPRRWRGHGAR